MNTSRDTQNLFDASIFCLRANISFKKIKGHSVQEILENKYAEINVNKRTDMNLYII